MRTLIGGRRPAESFPIGVDFAAPGPLATGETILLAGSTVTATIFETGVDVTSTMVVTGSTAVSPGDAISSVLSARIVDGTAGTRYLLHFRAATSESNIFEQLVLVTVGNQ